MRLPPLRERVEDIPDLVRHFLRKAEDEGLPPKTIEPGGARRAEAPRWPGNVRELENLIRRLAALYPDEDHPQRGQRRAGSWSATIAGCEEDEPRHSPAHRSSTISTSISRTRATGCRRPGLYDRVCRRWSGR